MTETKWLQEMQKAGWLIVMQEMNKTINPAEWSGGKVLSGAFRTG